MEPIETDQAEFVRIVGVLSELDLEDRAALIINLLAWFMLGMRVNHRDLAWIELRKGVQECMRRQKPGVH
jgi:hypothetical protein